LTAIQVAMSQVLSPRNDAADAGGCGIDGDWGEPPREGGRQRDGRGLLGEREEPQHRDVARE